MLVLQRLDSNFKETFKAIPRNFDSELKWKMDIHNSLLCQIVNKIYYLNFMININCESP
jgi:hypothetical protein